jgi:uncharacterized protein YndB with AHSA1/START domain
MNDRIEKQIELKAPLSRVWRALTDHEQFGEWFRVKIDGPFAEGKTSRGKILIPGYDHVSMDFTVQKIQPQTFFSYNWIPYAVKPDVDYSSETPTLVEFRLTPTTTGTLLEVTESGFDKVPAARREEAFRMNDGGWASQMKNIDKYVSQD